MDCHWQSLLRPTRQSPPASRSYQPARGAARLAIVNHGDGAMGLTSNPAWQLVVVLDDVTTLLGWDDDLMERGCLPGAEIVAR